MDNASSLTSIFILHDNIQATFERCGLETVKAYLGGGGGRISSLTFILVCSTVFDTRLPLDFVVICS